MSMETFIPNIPWLDNELMNYRIRKGGRLYRDGYEWKEDERDPSDSAQVMSFLLSSISALLSSLGLADVDDVVGLWGKVSIYSAVDSPFS